MTTHVRFCYTFLHLWLSIKYLCLLTAENLLHL